MKSKTNLPHRWYHFYKSRYEGMEVILGIRHLKDPNNLFWLVGTVEGVSEHSLLFQHYTGDIFEVNLDDIKKISLYSHEYFVRRRIKDPKWEYEQQLKEQQPGRKYFDYTVEE